MLLYEITFILIYNTLFSVLAPFSVGIFDKNLQLKSITRFPQVYKSGIERKFFNMRQFTIFLIDGVYGSVVSYYSALLIFDETSSYSGDPTSHLVLGTVAALYAITLSNLYIASKIYSVVFVAMCMISFGIVSAVVVTTIGSYLKRYETLLGVAVIFADIRFYLGLSLCIVAFFVPKVCVCMVWLMEYPDDHDIVREIEKLEEEKVAEYKETQNFKRMSPQNLSQRPGRAYHQSIIAEM